MMLELLEPPGFKVGAGFLFSVVEAGLLDSGGSFSAFGSSFTSVLGFAEPNALEIDDLGSGFTALGSFLIVLVTAGAALVFTATPFLSLRRTLPFLMTTA